MNFELIYIQILNFLVFGRHGLCTFVSGSNLNAKLQHFISNVATTTKFNQHKALMKKMIYILFSVTYFWMLEMLAYWTHIRFIKLRKFQQVFIIKLQFIAVRYQPIIFAINI